jgi:branched-chain amino acid aminotransferase
MNQSAKRLCMPEIPYSLFAASIKELVKIDKQWIPESEEASLYIRPVYFGTDEFLGVKPSDTYRYIVITGPVQGYYSEPVRVKIETEFVRAASGGTGNAKAAGNYAASLYPAKRAQDEGFHQLIWTDHRTHEYIEEAGTMNIMFVIQGKIVTPQLTDTILPSITRDSILTLAADMNIPVEERPVSVYEITDAYKTGQLQEAFGVGTAATVAPIASITYRNLEMKLPPMDENSIGIRLKKELLEIKTGKKKDRWKWIEKL